MEIREVQDGGVLVLAPEGNLASGEDCAALENRLAAVLKKGTRFLVVDCGGVLQLTSPAIRALLQTSRKLGRAEGRVVLCGMNAKVQKAFAISGFDRDFTVVGTRQEAVRRVLEPVVGVAPRPRPPQPAPKPAATKKPAAASAPAAAPPPEQAPPPVSAAPAASAAGPVAEAVAPPVVPAKPPEPDYRLALAAALLDALGGPAAMPAIPSRRDGAPPPDLDGLAGVVLTALQVRPA
jgi:anti-anti-sigma factor